MAKHFAINMQTVRELHRAGALEDAKQGYLSLLRQDPRNADMLHGLGILHTQQENFIEAIRCLEKAIQYQPEDPSISLHLANVYKIQGDFKKAIAILEKIIRSCPDYAAAYNNLGTVYFALDQFELATQYYRQSIAKNERYADAYYNLGLSLAKNLELTAAIETYQKLLHQVPNHFAARFQLANVYMQQNNLKLAINEFLTVEKDRPFHFETESNLATCYLKQGAFNLAKSHYLKALALRPTDLQVLYNLGIIHMQQGLIDKAIEYYQKAVHVAPGSFDAHNNLGVAFLAKHEARHALHHFKQALKLEPQNEAIAYTVNMLSQDLPMVSAPASYVQTLFDSYADHYDAHLLTALEYKAPSIFYETLSRTEVLTKPIDILDLGCGTGLAALPFKPYAKTLLGVDLSNKMLIEAKAKNIYDQLVLSDLIVYLNDKIAQYDLILSGDALVYIGELQLFFSLAHQALRPNGLLAFNAEMTEGISFKMDQTGRFCHSKQYLDELANAHYFKIISYQMAIVRLQNNVPVTGHVYVLQKYDKF